MKKVRVLKEMWKDAWGFAGLYQVSSWGLNNMKKCELCGTTVKVVGNTTHYYEPIVEEEKSLEGEFKEYLDKKNRLIIVEEKWRDITAKDLAQIAKEHYLGVFDREVGKKYKGIMHWAPNIRKALKDC